MNQGAFSYELASLSTNFNIQIQMTLSKMKTTKERWFGSSFSPTTFGPTLILLPSSFVPVC